MRTIKTRERQDRTIRMLARQQRLPLGRKKIPSHSDTGNTNNKKRRLPSLAIAAPGRLTQHNIHAVLRQRKGEDQDDTAANRYAVGKTETYGKRMVYRGVTLLDRGRRRHIIRSDQKRNRGSERSEGSHSKRTAERRKSAAISGNMRSPRRDSVLRRRQLAKEKAIRDYKERQKKARAAKKAARGISRRMAVVIKSLGTAVKTGGVLLAGSGTAVFVILVVTVFCGFAAVTCSQAATENQSVSAEVLAYTPLIVKYAGQYGMLEYVTLIQAVMMQESGGKGLDPMQAAEGPFNKKYPHVPNGITDPEYSIDVGIQELKDCLKRAGATAPYDIEKISLALQGYNFGNGYIAWALQYYGGYSAANAKTFSNMMAARMGWSRYGDPEYVPHVLRYYNMTGFAYGVSGGGMFLWPTESQRITSPFGPRNGRQHAGIDIGAPSGTPIYAAAAGTVTRVQYLTTGYGQNVIIDHGNGLQTLYGHMSAIYVSEGQPVFPGQLIGAVGSTGHSTGPHLHFEVRQNGTPTNPMPYLGR